MLTFGRSYQTFCAGASADEGRYESFRRTTCVRWVQSACSPVTPQTYFTKAMSGGLEGKAIVECPIKPESDTALSMPWMQGEEMDEMVAEGAESKSL